MRRFHPNVLVASAADQDGFVENGWLGCELGVGAAARLAVIDPCPRCVVTTLAQGELPSDPGILRTVYRSNAATSVTTAPGMRCGAVAGVCARVEPGGRIGRGDAITLSVPREAAEGAGS